MKARNYKIIKPVFFLFTIIWFFGIFIEWGIPYLEELVFLNLLADRSYSLVCHQDAEKLVTSDLYSSKVCARCTGIYAGAVLTIALLAFIKYKEKIEIRYLIAASVPIFIDVLLYNSGIYDYSKPIAFFTGLLFGSTGFFYIASGIEKFINELESSET